MITWQQAIEAIGYKAVELPISTKGNVQVQLKSKKAAIVAQGQGNTLEEAIHRATYQLPWDVNIIREKLLAAECNSICHL